MKQSTDHEEQIDRCWREKFCIQPLSTPTELLTGIVSPSNPAFGSTNRTRADQYGVHKTIEARLDLRYIIEYKPPHKFSADDLKSGFRETDLKEEVIDRIKIPRSIPSSSIACCFLTFLTPPSFTSFAQAFSNGQVRSDFISN